MATTGLEVRLRVGPDRVEVKRFTDALEQIVISLHEIDALYTRRPPERAKWVVAGLSQSESHLGVRVEARSRGRRPMQDLLVPADALVAGAEHLYQVSEIPPLYSPRTVERVADIATPKGGIEDVVVATYNGRVGKTVALSTDVRVHAKEAVRGREFSFGSVSGTLELLAKPRRSQDSLKVSIYDPHRRTAVIGIAPAGMEGQIHDLFGESVLAGGLVSRNSRGQAVRIDISDLEPMMTQQYPDADALLGVAPDWLGDMTVDEYITEVRGGG